MPAGPPPIIIKSYIAHNLYLKVQLLLQPFLIVADGNLTIDVNDWHSKLPRLAEHLIAGNLIPSNIKILIRDFVFVQQLLDFNAPGSGSGRINFNLSCHFILLGVFSGVLSLSKVECPITVTHQIKTASHNRRLVLQQI